MDYEAMRRSLDHVLWIGGSPCSGKSSVAEMLADRHGLAMYRCDDAFFEHEKRIDPAIQPTFHKIANMTWNEIWMRPVGVQVAEEIECYREEFDMIVADLLTYPKPSPVCAPAVCAPAVIAEGAALLPGLLSSVLLDRRRAMWIVPTEAFQRAHYTPEQRPWMRDILGQCEDPAQALRNWMGRDAGFARQVAEQARELSLALIEVDGKRTIEQNAQIVARHFELDVVQKQRGRK